VFRQHPAYNPEVAAVFQRRTTDYPVFRPQWSPRVGFRWEIGDDQRTSIRGGAGVFVGRPPLAWLLGPMRSIGSGVRTLTCSGAAVPAFAPYPAAQPATCADGVGPSNGAVDARRSAFEHGRIVSGHRSPSTGACRGTRRPVSKRCTLVCDRTSSSPISRCMVPLASTPTDV
jgi:hypothetical protein